MIFLKALLLFVVFSCRTNDTSQDKVNEENLASSRATDFAAILSKVQDTRIIRPQDISLDFVLEEKIYESDIKVFQVKFYKKDIEPDYIEMEICKDAGDCSNLASYSRSFFLDLDPGLYKLRARACVSFGHSETDGPFCAPFWTGWKILEQIHVLSEETKAKIQNDNSMSFAFFKSGEDFYQKLIGAEKDINACSDATAEDKKHIADLRKVPAINWARLMINEIFSYPAGHESALQLTAGTIPDDEMEVIRSYSRISSMIEKTSGKALEQKLEAIKIDKIKKLQFQAHVDDFLTKLKELRSKSDPLKWTENTLNLVNKYITNLNYFQKKGLVLSTLVIPGKIAPPLPPRDILKPASLQKDIVPLSSSPSAANIPASSLDPIQAPIHPKPFKPTNSFGPAFALLTVMGVVGSVTGVVLKNEINLTDNQGCAKKILYNLNVYLKN